MRICVIENSDVEVKTASTPTPAPSPTLTLTLTPTPIPTPILQEKKASELHAKFIKSEEKLVDTQRKLDEAEFLREQSQAVCVIRVVLGSRKLLVLVVSVLVLVLVLVLALVLALALELVLV